MSDTSGGVRLSIEMTTVVNYALQQNRLPIIQELVIYNDAPEPLQNVYLRIWSEPEIVVALDQNINLISAGTAFSLKNLKLSANGEFLAGLTERISGVLHIVLLSNDEILIKEKREITALAFDEWHGTAFFPELLAA